MRKILIPVIAVSVSTALIIARCIKKSKRINQSAAKTESR